MEAYIAYQDQLPAWELIIKHPKTTDVPSNAGACFVMAYRAIQAVDKNNIDAWMTYLERFEPEYQAAFCINIAKNPAKQQIAFASKKFADWVRSNEDIL